MSPSGRSRSNHPRHDRPTALTVPSPWPVHRRSGRLHLWLAGSPVAFAESSSLPFGTNPPIPTALHPALRRRGCLPLRPGGCLRDGHDFHMLSSWCCGRTSRGRSPRIIPAIGPPADVSSVMSSARALRLRPPEPWRRRNPWLWKKVIPRAADLNRGLPVRLRRNRREVELGHGEPNRVTEVRSMGPDSPRHYRGDSSRKRGYPRTVIQGFRGSGFRVSSARFPAFLHPSRRHG